MKFVNLNLTNKEISILKKSRNLRQYVFDQDGELVRFGDFQKGKVYFEYQKNLPYVLTKNDLIRSYNRFYTTVIILWSYCPKKNHKNVGSFMLYTKTYEEHNGAQNDIITIGKTVASCVNNVSDLDAILALLEL